ncbi:MAG: helix-turn-helix domain-containing protein [Lachnospiraceae bacterium]|nr:helix-turn-helix domain-containing protein [Lachnospiraceae bacterium]
MTIGELLQERGLSRYRLSKESGVPWVTLSDICSGKTKFERCSAATLAKLSKVLGVTMEELLLLETGKDMDKAGKPKNKTYLEKGLPESLQKAVDEYIQGEKEEVSHMDCLLGELYGSINACQWDGRITKEQAEYLRKKYLFTDMEADTDD